MLVELDRGSVDADLAAATASFEKAAASSTAVASWSSTQVLSKAQYEQLEATMKSNEARMVAAQARFADTYIRAPFSGRVGLRRVSLGTLINPGTVITTLDDLSSVKVDFAVPEIHVCAAAQRAGRAGAHQYVAGPRLHGQRVEHGLARRSDHAFGDGACSGSQPGCRAAARHVPDGFRVAGTPRLRWSFRRKHWCPSRRASSCT